MTKADHCTHSMPDGVLACGCTSDVVDALHATGGSSRGGERGLWATVEAHVQEYLGPLLGVIHDGTPGQEFVDVLVHGPGAERTSFDLVTAGMSTRRMRAPRAVRRHRRNTRAELVLRLPVPEGKPCSNSAEFLGCGFGWSLEWLHLLGRWPHHGRVFIGDHEDLPMENRVVPLDPASSGPFPWALATHPARFGRPWSLLRAEEPIRLVGADRVTFLSLVPIFEMELEFAMNHGAERLLAMLSEAGVDDIVREVREAVI